MKKSNKNHLNQYLKLFTLKSKLKINKDMKVKKFIKQNIIK